MSNSGGGLGDVTKMLGKAGPVALAVLIVTVLAVAGLSRVGCMNLHTPPGHEGYLRSTPIFGAGKFVGTQEGPTSTGWVWRQEVVNIDTRPRTYSEDMEIRTSRGSKLRFRAHARIGLRAGQVKDVVEKFGGEAWYQANVQKQFQSEIRALVQQKEPFEVKNEADEIARQVLEAMKKRYDDSPVEFLTVDIGNIDYPEEIVQSVIRKFVTQQQDQKAAIQGRIAQEQIAIGEEDAKGVAEAQTIIRTTLDPMFLQYEALQAVEQLAGSPNTTFLIAPFGGEGGAPLIMNLDK